VAAHTTYKNKRGHNNIMRRHSLSFCGEKTEKKEQEKKAVLERRHSFTVFGVLMDRTTVAARYKDNTVAVTVT
jgi:hypothetical protein